MTVRDVVLFGLLAAVGAYGFRWAREGNREHLAALRDLERDVAAEAARLRQQHRELRAEAKALRSDPYYVERLLREQHGWRPSHLPEEAAPPAPVPPPADPAGELAHVTPQPAPPAPHVADPPQPVQQQPPPVEPSAPEPPPQPPPADADRELLGALGYTSVAHFQRKMMNGHGSGELDEATRLRIRSVAVLLRRLGYASVTDFQRAHGLGADGIYGQKTEQAVIRELRRHRSVVVENGHSSGDGG